MVNRKQLASVSLVSTLIASVSTFAFAQADLGSDIFIANVDYVLSKDKPSPVNISLSQFQKITDTPSYTNQPYFFNEDTQLAYTQSVTADELTQTDIFIYSMATQSSLNLTNSATSEYSPTPTPDGKGVSVIRVNAKGKQELWNLALTNGLAKQNLLPAIEPVGYHAWNGSEQVLLFVLGEPHTLRIAKVNQQTDQGRVLDTSIGPSLWAIPGTELFSYSKQIDDTTWQLRSVDMKKKTTSALVDMPKGSYYYAWSPKGYAVTAVDNKLYQWQYSKPGTNAWTELADLSNQCSAGITRLSFSQQSNKIALVCNRPHNKNEMVKGGQSYFFPKKFNLR